MLSIAVFIVLIVDMITGIIDSIGCFTSGEGTDCQITCTFLFIQSLLKTQYSNKSSLMHFLGEPIPSLHINGLLWELSVCISFQSVFMLFSSANVSL